jgi:Mn-dependent DtxR family transcriptional regulator
MPIPLSRAEIEAVRLLDEHKRALIGKSSGVSKVLSDTLGENPRVAHAVVVRLEGRRLVTRKGRYVILTHAGRRMAERLARVGELLEEIEPDEAWNPEVPG